MESFATSPGRKDIPSEERFCNSDFLEAEGEDIAVGRRRTDILVDFGAWDARAVRTEVPSSPAPRTRMLDAILKLWD